MDYGSVFSRKCENNEKHEEYIFLCYRSFSNYELIIYLQKVILSDLVMCLKLLLMKVRVD